VQFAAHAVAMTCVVWNPVLYFWMSQVHNWERGKKASIYLYYWG
jgi:hypothetical protein